MIVDELGILLRRYRALWIPSSEFIRAMRWQLGGLLQGLQSLKVEFPEPLALVSAQVIAFEEYVWRAQLFLNDQAFERSLSFCQRAAVTLRFLHECVEAWKEWETARAACAALKRQLPASSLARLPSLGIPERLDAVALERLGRSEPRQARVAATWCRRELDRLRARSPTGAERIRLHTAVEAWRPPPDSPARTTEPAALHRLLDEGYHFLVERLLEDLGREARKHKTSPENVFGGAEATLQWLREIADEAAAAEMRARTVSEPPARDWTFSPS
jgi:hypothetical protein